MEKLKTDFLKDDLYNALKELFVGAVTWHAHPQKTDTRFLRDLGMFTCFVQARALYEFFYGKQGAPDSGSTASANHFAKSWRPLDRTKLRSRYMGKNTPAQKRVFHLVYGRSQFPGGVMQDESDHLKNQVLAFAVDLRRLTEEFVAACDKKEHRDLANSALTKALDDAHRLAHCYGCDLVELKPR